MMRPFLFLVILFFLFTCSCTFAPTQTALHATPAKQPVMTQSLPASKDYSSMQAKIDKIIQDQASFSYSFIDLTTEQELTHRSHAMPSASMIKMFIMAKVMQDIQDGKLSLDTRLTMYAEDKVGGAGTLQGCASGSSFSIDTLLHKMIIESDNTATNMLIDRIGMDAVNTYIRQNGYHDTVLQRKMMDLASLSAGKDNFTSTRDLAKLFHHIYRQTCVSPQYDAQMIDILLQQEDTDKIPLYLPPNTKVAHKTGEINCVLNDGGIIYGSQNDFILVLMSEDSYSLCETKSCMGRVSRLIYDELNP